MIKRAGCPKNCKCFQCRLLRAKYAKEYRDRIKLEGKPERNLTHGLKCYWRGCRRKRCRLAGARYHRKWRGTELQPLKDVKPIIHTSTTVRGLANKAQLAPATILNIKQGRTRRVRQSTERKIIEAGVAT